MSEHSGSEVSVPNSESSSTKDELRTIGFRLREIQRLLAIRVAQENRWLEADGHDPVTEGDFSRTPPHEDSKP